jgi:hypothetical protein
MRRIAIAGAVLILFGEFLSAVHEHRLAFSDSTNASTALTADSGPCALCLFAFHSNLNPAARCSLEHPRPEAAPVAAPSCSGFNSFDPASSLKRAPPLSA